ncbi:thermonuclease family protein [Algoriphagus sp. CAU 1675]|uniref:thermonuclease family protein n=1 Tax=Algoriphagus sp. CAU 1675 TaxID=3032597 RepID=UPI0023DB4DBA|nr:thermonuclease family protein [Algoriphagus sp. CAU 1675]MDF2157410.1 thermonuclease family protein [Algoriphagus sp. CAU 1675]
MRTLLFFLIISIIPIPILEEPLQTKTLAFEIIKFVDGDTFWIRNEKGEDEKIRLIGIDSPESRRTGRTEIEYYGKEASEYLKNLLSGKGVELKYDVQRYDRYGRTLAYAYLENGTFINALLVAQGYAQVATFPPNVKYASYFIQLEREAKNLKKGMWQDPS